MGPDDKQEDCPTNAAVSTEEAFALLRYAINAGINKEKVAALSEEIHKPKDVMESNRVATLYADLTEETKPVTGRTVADSTASAHKRLGKISLATALFFIGAVGHYIADSWIGDLDYTEGNELWLNLKYYIWDTLLPFFWGGLGSCIYLLKTVEDAARAHLYEHHQLTGWLTRILAGSLLAGIILILFAPIVFDSETLPMTPAAIAFLVGFGVKAFYSILERVIETLATRFQP